MNSELPLKQFNPVLITAYLFNQGMTMRRGQRLETRRVIDYEIEFILESSGFQEIDGKTWPIRKGDLVLRRPGQSTCGIMPYNCYCLIFDLKGELLERPFPYVKAWENEGRGWVCQMDHRSTFLEPLPAVFHPDGAELFRNLFEASHKHFISPGTGGELLQKSALLQILYQFHAQVMDPLTAGESKAIGQARREMLRELLAFMRRNYRRKLPLEELAKQVDLSPSYLHRVFSEIMGQSPLDYLNRLRLDAARELLATTNLSAASIAHKCGYDNVPYFFTLFKRATGETPAGFRQAHRFL